MTKKNTEAIVKLSKEKSITREKEIMDAIKKMKRNGQKVTFYSVANVTKASKSYLHTNPNIYEAICGAKLDNNTFRSGESKTVIITALKKKVKELESENSALQKKNDDSYKAKYEREHELVLELQKQLKTAYKYNN